MREVAIFTSEKAQESSHLINQRNLLHVTPCCKVHWSLTFNYAKGPKKPNALQVGDAG